MLFGIAVVALGVEHFVCAGMALQFFPTHFRAMVIPVIPWIPAHPWLAFAVGAALVLAGASILFDVRARAGALLTAGILLAAGVFLQIPRMLLVPRDWALRGEVFEILALAAAALMVAGTSRRAEVAARLSDAVLADMGRVIFGVAAVVFGVDHFLALDLIASLVPAWLPAHVAVASLTGATMVIAGACFITKRLVGPAAFALGVMFLLFVLTLHLPRVLAAWRDPNQWSSALIALAMCGASWVCAATAVATTRSAPGIRNQVYDGKPVPSLER
jgi:uncharacterized membrane protein